MIQLGLAQRASLVAEVAVQEIGEGPSADAALGGSSGMLVPALLVIGVLFLLAGTLAHEPGTHGHRESVRR